MSRAISVRKSDVIWNYIGTIASMASNFLLLPLLMVYLTKEQIGLWYVFTAISGFAQLLEFGFTSTLSRNILFCLSGAQKLEKKGVANAGDSSTVNWHLMNSVLRTSKLIYAIMGIIALLLSLTVGSAYVSLVTDGFSISASLSSWFIFIISIFTNLYFLYCLTFLRGLGDIAGENKAKSLARAGQLITTAILLVLGFELLAASIGFLVYSTLLRVIAIRIYKGHTSFQEGIHSDAKKTSPQEMRDVFNTVSYIAWRDGVVSLSWYGATQAMSLLCSAFLGLGETAIYSTMLQFATAIYYLASGYVRSCFPMFQAAYVRNDTDTQREVVERGTSSYLILYWIGTLLVSVVVLPLLPIIKPDFRFDTALFLGICVYYFLLNQHSTFCNLIVSMNEIPYFKSYLISTVLGIALSSVLSGVLHWGAWGLVLGQAIPQLCYNNWYWPQYVLKRVKITYISAIKNGAKWWVGKMHSYVTDKRG